MQITTDEPKNPAAKRAVWFKLIEDYNASGQTQINFCKLQNINKDQFVYYLAQWRKINNQRSPHVPFQRVEVVKSMHSKCFFNVAPGVNLEFPEGISLVELSELLINLRKILC